MGVVIEADPAEISNPVIFAMNAEPMQVFLTPVKGSLNVLVELSDGGLTGVALLFKCVEFFQLFFFVFNKVHAF